MVDMKGLEPLYPRRELDLQSSAIAALPHVHRSAQMDFHHQLALSRDAL